MTRAAPIPETLALHVPFRILRRGGRKEIRLPADVPASHRTDNTMVKALGRAFRWKRMLGSGEFSTIADLAQNEGIAPSYLTRILRLTLLAPDVVEAILDGRQGSEVTLSRLASAMAAKFRLEKSASDAISNSVPHWTVPRLTVHRLSPSI